MAIVHFPRAKLEPLYSAVIKNSVVNTKHFICASLAATIKINSDFFKLCHSKYCQNLQVVQIILVIHLLINSYDFQYCVDAAVCGYYNYPPALLQHTSVTHYSYCSKLLQEIWSSADQFGSLERT